MKCVAEERLALYAGGDLSEKDAAEVERHIRTCAACAVLVEELRDAQAIFKSFRDDSVTPEALAAVRTQVFDKVGRVEASRWLDIERLLFAGFRRYALAGVAVAVLAAGLVWYSRPPALPNHEPERVATVMPSPAGNVAVPTRPEVKSAAAVRPVQHVRRHTATRTKPTRAVVEAPRQIVMKIVTDDPNVVIYWLFNEKGD